MFINEKGKIVAELGDEKWLWDLALLCVIIHQYYWIPDFKVNRTLFLICLGVSELLKWSWKYFGNSLKTLTCVIFLPVIYFIRMDQ